MAVVRTLTKDEWDEVRGAGRKVYRDNMKSPEDSEEAAAAKADEARNEALQDILRYGLTARDDLVYVGGGKLGYG